MSPIKILAVTKTLAVILTIILISFHVAVKFLCYPERLVSPWVKQTESPILPLSTDLMFDNDVTVYSSSTLLSMKALHGKDFSLTTYLCKTCFAKSKEAPAILPPIPGSLPSVNMPVIFRSDSGYVQMTKWNGARSLPRLREQKACCRSHSNGSTVFPPKWWVSSTCLLEKPFLNIACYNASWRSLELCHPRN